MKTIRKRNRAAAAALAAVLAAAPLSALALAGPATAEPCEPLVARDIYGGEIHFPNPDCIREALSEKPVVPTIPDNFLPPRENPVITATIPDNLPSPRDPIVATIPDNLPSLGQDPVAATIPDNLPTPAGGPRVIGPPGYQPQLPPDPPWCPDGTPRPPDRPCRWW
jgi:hypothetical protein